MAGVVKSMESAMKSMNLEKVIIIVITNNIVYIIVIMIILSCSVIVCLSHMWPVELVLIVSNKASDSDRKYSTQYRWLHRSTHSSVSHYFCILVVICRVDEFRTFLLLLLLLKHHYNTGEDAGLWPSRAWSDPPCRAGKGSAQEPILVVLHTVSRIEWWTNCWWFQMWTSWEQCREPHTMSRVIDIDDDNDDDDVCVCVRYLSWWTGLSSSLRT